VFGQDMVRAHRTRDEDSVAQVIIVFAFRQPMTLLPLWSDQGYGPGVDRLSYELSRREVSTAGEGGVVITDDLNPIDLARAETALEWRRQTMELLR
jgi:hypothetical protein